MNLEDLTPRAVTVEMDVSEVPEQPQLIELVLRPFSLRDDAWTNRNYTKESLAKIFEKIDMPEIAKMVFNQLNIESKRTVMATTIMDMDEEGNEFEVKMNGPEKLMAMTKGFTNSIRLYKALLESKGLSMPVLEKIAEDDLKKKGVLTEKDTLIGVLSSI